MTLSNYEKALELMAKKPVKKETMAFMEISYLKMVLPVASAILVLSALKEARSVTDFYSNPKIGGLNLDALTMKLLSEEEVTDIEVASMLDVSLEEARNARTSFNKRIFENE